MQTQETTLGVLGSDDPSARVSVCLVRCQVSGCTRVCLREESFSPDVGWFTQGEIELCPSQVAQLRGALGVLPASARNATPLCQDSHSDDPCVLKLPTNRAG